MLVKLLLTIGLPFLHWRSQWIGDGPKSFCTVHSLYETGIQSPVASVTSCDRGHTWQVKVCGWSGDRTVTYSGEEARKRAQKEAEERYLDLSIDANHP